MTSFKKNSIKVLNSAVVRIIVGVIICAFIPLFIQGMFSANLVDQGGIPPFWYSLVVFPAFILPYYFLFHFWEKRQISELGIQNIGFNTVGAFLFGFILIAFILLITMIFSVYKVESVNSSSILLNRFMLLLVMSAFEEIGFRGIIYRITEEKIGTNLALIISSVLFGLAHLNNAHFSIISLISIILAGLFLGLIYNNTQGLWAPIFVHLGWNYAQNFFGVNVSGNSTLPKFINAEISGPDWITGGEFGFENSYIAVAVLAVLVFLLYRRSKQKGYYVPFKKRPAKHEILE